RCDRSDPGEWADCGKAVKHGCGKPSLASAICRGAGDPDNLPDKTPRQKWRDLNRDAQNNSRQYNKPPRVTNDQTVNEDEDTGGGDFEIDPGAIVAGKERDASYHHRHRRYRVIG